jgi:hypothetical protein
LQRLRHLAEDRPDVLCRFACVGELLLQDDEITHSHAGISREIIDLPTVTTPAAARTTKNAAANFAMRDCSAGILPLMRASAPLRRLSSASNTAVAFGMTTARRQRREH